MTIVVVGAGISGLTAAYRLHQRGADYRLIEASPTAGGVIATEHDRGFIIEGGPDSFLAEKPWARELCEELGLSNELITTNQDARKIYIVSRGKLRPLPAGLVRLIPTKPLALIRSRLLSLPGAIRAGLEPFVPAREDRTDEAIGAWARRRFGDELHERLIDPLLGGIYAGDADTISICSTFPHLAELERRGSVLRALRTSTSAPKAAFLSLRGGIGQLVEELLSRLDPGRVALNTRVASVKKNGVGFRIDFQNAASIDARALILAIPAWAAAELVDGIDSSLSALLRAIPHASTATISLAYKAADITRPLDGFGFVVPRIEQRRITACTWVTSKLADRAPAGTVLLRCFIGRAGDETWISHSDDELVQIACNELRDLMAIDASPLLTRVFRWTRRMPQYLVGHQEHLQKIDAALTRHDGLHLTGCSYRGVGMPDCIRQAGEQVTRVLEETQLPGRLAPKAHG